MLSADHALLGRSPGCAEFSTDCGSQPGMEFMVTSCPSLSYLLYVGLPLFS